MKPNKYNITELSKNCRTTFKGIICVYLNTRRKKGMGELFQSNNGQNVPQINDRHNTTEPGSSEDIKEEICQRNFKIIFKHKKAKTNRTSWKKPEGRKLPVVHQTSHRNHASKNQVEWNIYKMLKGKNTNLEFYMQ